MGRLFCCVSAGYNLLQLIISYFFADKPYANSFEENLEELENLEAKKLIAKIQKDIIEHGATNAGVISGLKELRPYAIEEKDPTVTKVIRLAYEHLEEFDGFFIGMPVDEEDLPAEGVDGLDDQSDSLYYLVSLLINSKNQTNRDEIFVYRDALKEYWSENA